MTILLNLSGIDEEMGGNYSYIDGMNQDELFVEKTNNFQDTGIKISVTLPEDKRLRLTRAILEPSNYENNSNHCYADILFGGLDIASMYYGNDGGSNTEERTGVLLHGDGIRKLEINIKSINGEFVIRLEGYYVKNKQYTPSKSLRINSTELSPDEIKLIFDAPEDNGGLPLTEMQIFRTKTPMDNSSWNKIHTIMMTPDLAVDISYIDTNLENNQKYFYKVRGVNSKGTGEFSSIVSAVTEIDHPYPITNTVVSIYNSTQLKIIWNNPIDTGGIPLQGIEIQRSLFFNSDFTIIVPNTNNLTTQYIDTGLNTNTEYFYKLYAINESGKKSLISSIITSGIPLYGKPTNLIISLESENTISKLDWEEPLDKGGLLVMGYIIIRSLDNDIFSELISNTGNNNTTYNDNTVQGNTVYYYKVIAIINNKESPESLSSSIIIPIRKPTFPTNLSAQTESSSKVILSWFIPNDDGGSPLNGYIIDYSKYSDFSNANSIDVGLITNYTLTDLDSDTLYYFRVKAKNVLHVSDYSPTANTTTRSRLFSESEIDLIVNVGEVVNIGSEQYRSITNEGEIIVSAGIIRSDTYDDKNIGIIKVKDTGCLGGIGGTTHNGVGGAQVARLTSSSNPGSSAVLNPPTTAIACTDLDLLSAIIDDSLDIDLFTTKFMNQITGGKGSDGTDALPSGSGGNSGGGGRWANSWYVGLAGGNGGRGANGVNGVRGSGKIALFFRNIISGLTVISNGLDGINGIKGSNSNKTDADTISEPSWASGSEGGNANTNGSLGSKGSQGGIVFLVYDTISDMANISIDVSGGLGGFGGEVESSLNELTTIRSESGDDGIFVIRTHEELLL